MNIPRMGQRPTMGRRLHYLPHAALLLAAAAFQCLATAAAQAPPLQTAALPPNAAAAEAPGAAPPADEPTLKLGAGDAVAVQVYGRPEMSVTTYVGDDGNINVPLAGAVHVAGLAPAQAAAKVGDKLRAGQFLLNPQVTITLAQYRSQQVSVLGAVKTPGRYPLESRTTVIDLLAQAGGQTDDGADVIYVLRPAHNGGVERFPVNLTILRDGRAPLPTLALRGGDSVFVPRADHYYIYGEVAQPNSYRLEPGMTVVQAISRGGGVTARGSAHRVEIIRDTADGKHVTVDAKLFDPVEPNDVIRVKERIF